LIPSEENAMPLFDFRCRACGATFEALVRGASQPACPQCAASEPERLVSAIAPAGKSAGLIAGARRQAAREGHFSNYSRSERAKLAK
jgi:putative FmdB family regulatory protein